jgi:hypothetical protein
VGVSEREKIHHELLDALFTARKRVENLEAALAHNATFLGIGVEREERPAVGHSGSRGIPDAILRYLELVEPDGDISDYIGREDDEESRPRLGKDAPNSIRPKKEPGINARIDQIALGHPADAITFDFSGASEDETPAADRELSASPGIVPSSQVKNEFLAKVRHDLYTSGNGILRMLQMLQHSPLTGEQAEWVGAASQSARDLLRVISDMPDFFAGDS